MNLPNRLTVARLIMVPAFVVFMMMDTAWGYFLAWFIFIAASVTDWLDGRIARAQNLVTSFGKLMDPIADKILVASAFVMMMEIDVLRIPGWTVVAILAREFLVTGARSMAAAEGSVIAANMWGKTKAMIQMIFIGVFSFVSGACLMAQDFYPDEFQTYADYVRQISHWTIVLVAIFTVYSGLQFARSNWAALRLGMKE